MPPQSVIDRATEIGADLWLLGRDFNSSGDKQQWAWAGRGRRYAGLAYPALRGANQLINASGVLAALTAMRQQLPVTAQAVRNGLALVDLPGRFQVVPGQPALVLDVAHNPHSVAALALNLDAMGFYPTTHAVFGAMADKDLAPMLHRMDPLVDRWYFADLPTPRAASGAALQAAWQAVTKRTDAVSAVFSTPLDALHAAAAKAQETLRRRRPQIESSSSDRSTPWAACWSTAPRACKPAPPRRAPAADPGIHGIFQVSPARPAPTRADPRPWPQE